MNPPPCTRLAEQPWPAAIADIIFWTTGRTRRQRSIRTGRRTFRPKGERDQDDNLR